MHGSADPVKNAALEGARLAASASDLRQIGLGIQMYADAHGGMIVPCGYYGTMDGFDKAGIDPGWQWPWDQTSPPSVEARRGGWLRLTTGSASTAIARGRAR